jgi:hypothetical protein
MEKRAFKRINISLSGEVIHKNRTYSAYIGNISERGLYALITPADNIDFSLPPEIDMKCQIKPGRILNLTCGIKWSLSFSHNTLTKRMGMEIIDPPAEFTDYIYTLY